MSYDFEARPDPTDRSPPRIVTGPPPDPHDLEVIVVLLELAALHLTPASDATFTFDELIAKTHEIGGPELLIDPRDAAIVLPFMRRTIGKRGRRLFLA